MGNLHTRSVQAYSSIQYPFSIQTMPAQGVPSIQTMPAQGVPEQFQCSVQKVGKCVKVVPNLVCVSVGL